MLRWRRSASEDGSASLEFITVGLVLLVPLVYLVLALSALQSGSLAVEGAARQAARVFVDAEDEKQASDASARAVQVALADYGLTAREVRVTCAPDPRDCLASHSVVTVRVQAVVTLPLMPPIIVGDVPAGIPVTSSASQQVSRFAGGER